MVIIIIAAAIGLYVFLARQAPKPKSEKVKTKLPLVRTLTMSTSSESIKVHATGTVIPAQEIVLQAQVSGQIINLNPALMPGGILEKGETVLTLDPRDYEDAIVQAEAQVDKGRLNLALETSRATIAKEEWQLLQPSSDPGDTALDLVLRKPQLAFSISELKAAEHALSQAKRQLERTRLVAPFDTIVQSESADIGQLITPQTLIAHLVGTEQFWVQVSVPVETLQWINLPDSSAKSGVRVEISQRESNASYGPYSGRLIRLLGDLESKSRLARLLIAIDQPLQQKPIPLLLGTYVHVSIQGKTLNKVIKIPRIALRHGQSVWIYQDDGTLSIRPCRIVWKSRTHVFIPEGEGLTSGDRVITSPLSTPIDRMKLRLQVSQE